MGLGHETTARTAKTLSRSPFCLNQWRINGPPPFSPRCPPLIDCRVINCRAMDGERGLRCCRSFAGRVEPSRLVQDVNDVFPQPSRRPAPEPAIDAQPFSELFRHATPRSASPSDRKMPAGTRRQLVGLRPFGARTARMKCSKNAHSPSEIRPRAKLVSYHRYKIESPLTIALSPCCQHSLVAGFSRTAIKPDSEKCASALEEPPAL